MINSWSYFVVNRDFCTVLHPKGNSLLERLKPEFEENVSQKYPKQWHKWSPYVIGQTIIFSCCGLFFFLFFSSPNLSGWRLDVYHTLAHGVALVRI